MAKAYKKVKGGFCLCCKTWDQETQWLCMTCAEQFPWIEAACQRCAYPLVSNQLSCGHCLESWPHQGLQSQAIFKYTRPMDTLIGQFKYHRKIGWGPCFGDLMAKNSDIDEMEAITCPPTHIKSLRKRGYNPALELAKRVALWSGKPLIHPFDVICDLPPQMAQSRQQRQKLAGKRFGLMRSVNYQKVLLVDDILTTGATLLALVKLLQDHGVKKIKILVLARAISHKD